MLAIPFRVSDTQFSVFVILGDDNVKRIQEYDPAEVSLPKIEEQAPAHGPWSRLRVKDVVIAYANPAEMERVMALCAEGKVVEALRLVSRGFRHRPEEGDHDGPYLSLRTERGETKQ